MLSEGFEVREIRIQSEIGTFTVAALRVANQKIILCRVKSYA